MDLENKTNLVLIGMPGSGKSTVGVILARLMGKSFIDTDVLIQTSEGRSLQQILDAEGYLGLRRIEERVLLGMTCRNCVIATGGSAAYSEAAMTHLRAEGTIIFLRASLETVKARITNVDSRGIAKSPEQTFEDLFAERHTLYTRYADFTLEVDSLTQEEAAEGISRLEGPW